MATDYADLSHTPIFGQISSNPVLRDTSRRALMPAPVRGAPSSTMCLWLDEFSFVRSSFVAAFGVLRSPTTYKRTGGIAQACQQLFPTCPPRAALCAGMLIEVIREFR